MSLPARPPCPPLAGGNRAGWFVLLRSGGRCWAVCASSFGGTVLGGSCFVVQREPCRISRGSPLSGGVLSPSPDKGRAGEGFGGGAAWTRDASSQTPLSPLGRGGRCWTVRASSFRGDGAGRFVPLRSGGTVLDGTCSLRYIPSTPTSFSPQALSTLRAAVVPLWMADSRVAG